VSSDSDFTALAIRLTGAGYPVFGFGSRRTPEALRSALTKFISIDGSQKGPKVAPAKQPVKAGPTKKAAPAKKATPAKEPAASMPRQLSADDEAAIIAAIEATKRGEGGWASLNEIGKALHAAGRTIRHLSAKLQKLASIEVEGSGNAQRARVRPTPPRKGAKRAA
jgi:hypothetical protein